MSSALCAHAATPEREGGPCETAGLPRAPATRRLPISPDKGRHLDGWLRVNGRAAHLSHTTTPSRCVRATCYLVAARPSAPVSTMGSDQSKQSDEAAITEELLERLQALNMHHHKYMNEKDGYIVVDGETEARTSMLRHLENPLGTDNLCSAPVHSRRQVSAERIHPICLRMGKGATGRSKGTLALLRLFFFPWANLSDRTVLPSQLLAPTLPTLSCLPARPPSPMPKSSTSRSPSRALPSQTKPHPGDVGCLRRPMSSASLS